jgi:lysophospholipase L1-like esterase
VTALRLALLGDSIAFGTGAARTADTLASRLVADLAARGTRAESRVLAVSGARSADLARQVAAVAAWRPHVVVVHVGGNDLTHLTPFGQAVADLAAAVRALRALGSQVVVVPVPDLSVVAHVPPQARGLVRAAGTLLRGAQVRAARVEGGLVAELGDGVAAAFADDPSLFCADRFHPSSAGYALIAAAIAPVVRAAAAAASGAADEPGRHRAPSA